MQSSAHLLPLHQLVRLEAELEHLPQRASSADLYLVLL
jgi:hypothetical protein